MRPHHRTCVLTVIVGLVVGATIWTGGSAVLQTHPQHALRSPTRPPQAILAPTTTIPEPPTTTSTVPAPPVVTSPQTVPQAPMTSPVTSPADSGGIYPSVEHWLAINQCEQGGDWHAYGRFGNGLMGGGGLGLSDGAWQEWGGLQYAANASLATPEQQMLVASVGYRRYGASPWGCKV